MQILSQKDMQNRSINERFLNLSHNISTSNNDHIMREYNIISADDDPLLIMNDDSNAISTHIKTKNGIIHINKSSRGKDNSGSRKKAEGTAVLKIPAQSINQKVIKADNIQFNQQSIKIELEGFSNKNSEAKYTKNLKFRKKLK